MHQTTRRLLFLPVLLLLLAHASAQGFLQEGFGRFGRFHDDGLLTLNIHPDRMEVSGLTLRFAGDQVVANVLAIDTTAKHMGLAETGAGDALSVRYTLLYPGFEAEFGTTARLRLSRSTLVVEELGGGGGEAPSGLLLRPSSGTMVPVGIGFSADVAAEWSLAGSGAATELVLTSDEPLGFVRFFTPNGTQAVGSSLAPDTLQHLRDTAAQWASRSVPVMVDREVDVDFDTGTVTVTESFLSAGGESIAPVPPVLAFAIENGYPASVQGELRRSGFITRYGEFAWVDGDRVTYTLPIPPHEERGILRPFNRATEVALLNDMTSRLGATWATNAVDLGYVGMAPAQMAWPMLNQANRTSLATAWATYLPLAFRFPPYAPADPRKTWVLETEPLSGLEYWYTYFITGGPGGAYKLDLEWGNLLPVYGLAKYAQFTGDWDFVRDRWDSVARVMLFTDYADDWAWMTNTNGDMGWSTGTGDPMTAAYVGHVAALRMARILGDDEAARRYAYRASRVAVPTVSRFWYTDWARARGVIGPNSIVQGFWEKSTFTSTVASQNSTDPWGPTNPLSGNGAQHEFFAAMMRFAPDALQRHQDIMDLGYPNLFDPDFVYPVSTTYGGNSVYVTFPNIHARIVLGGETDSLWGLVNATQSNRRTTSWIAPMTISELLARDSPLILTEWQPLRWVDGAMTTSSTARMTFEAPGPGAWSIHARRNAPTPIVGIRVNGDSVPTDTSGERFVIPLSGAGPFEVLVDFEAPPCAGVEVIVDNETAGAFYTTGTWSVSANTPFVGSNSLFSYGGSPASVATWRAEIECGGIYAVYASWVASTNRTSAARYLVGHVDGITEVVVDQKINGNRWNLLGEFRFAARDEAAVSLTNAGVLPAEIVSADAIHLVLLEPDGPATTWVLH